MIFKVTYFYLFYPCYDRITWRSSLKKSEIACNRHTSSVLSLACFVFVIRHSKHISSHDRSLFCKTWLLMQLLSHGFVTITLPPLSCLHYSIHYVYFQGQWLGQSIVLSLSELDEVSVSKDLPFWILCI